MPNPVKSLKMLYFCAILPATAISRCSIGLEDKSLILQTTYSQPTFFILVNILIQSYSYKIKTMSHINFDCVILCSLVLPIFLFFILILLSLKQYCYFVWDKIETNNELLVIDKNIFWFI